jgi:uncharacterized protein
LHFGELSMTRIDLRSIPENGKHYTFHFEPESWPSEEEEEGAVLLDGPLEVELDVQRAGKRKYILTGRLRGGLRVRCDRCLELFHRDLAISYQTFLELPHESASDAEVELQEEDLDVAFRIGEEVDVLDIVREQVLLDLPMKRLCREDCKGLCPRCGGNLNQGACGCPEESGHPAFQKLKLLKTDGEI